MPIIRQTESITDEFCAKSTDTQGNDVPATYSTSVNLFTWKQFTSQKNFGCLGLTLNKKTFYVMIV